MKEAKRLVLEDLPDPEPGPREVVVKVKNVGICGSDLHLYTFGLLPPDFVMGHEVTGTVATVGSEVGDWKEGDRVWVASGGPCGECAPCKEGRTGRCQKMTAIGIGALPGGYSEYIKVPQSFLVALPEKVGMREGTLVDPVGCGHYAVRLSGIEKGQSALVMGGGPIGLFLVQALKHKGIAPVILSEPVAGRAEIGVQLGADHVLNPGAGNTEQQAKELTGGLGPSVVFECVGLASAIHESVALVRWGGKVVWVGVCMEEVTFRPVAWFFKQISINLSLGFGGPDYVPQYIEFIEEKQADLRKAITETISLDELPQTFERLLKPSTEMKVLVEF